MPEVTDALPDKLSDLLELAVNDAEALENTPGYGLDMKVWHRPNGVCRVCMAGAVIARTMGVAPTLEADPQFMEHEIRAKLYAIDSMRIGDFLDAADRLDTDLPARISRDLDEIRLEYEDLNLDEDGEDIGTGRLSWERYRDAVRILREAGL